MLPVLIENNFLTIFSYPLFMGLSWGIGYYLSLFYFQQNNASEKGFNLFFLGSFLSSWLGAKLLFIYASANGEFANYTASASFWLGGGFVFLGGLIAGLLFIYIYSFVLKKIKFTDLSYVLPGLALGHGVGRIGCFLAGCCFGKQCDLSISIFMHGSERHAVQLYEALSLFALGLILHRMIMKKNDSKIVLGTYLVGYGVLRFTLEFFRGDKVRGSFLEILSTSQILSLLIFILGSLILFKNNGLTKRND